MGGSLAAHYRVMSWCYLTLGGKHHFAASPNEYSGNGQGSFSRLVRYWASTYPPGCQTVNQLIANSKMNKLCIRRLKR